MSKEEITSNVLKWGDTKEEIDKAHNAEELGIEDNENEEASLTEELGTDTNKNEEANFKGMNEASPSSTRAHSSVTRDENPSVLGMVRRIPPWMQDYETGENLLEEEDLNVMIILTEVNPSTFEETVKSKKLRDAMNKEIEAIERNKTWVLTALPKGVNNIGVK